MIGLFPTKVGELFEFLEHYTFLARYCIMNDLCEERLYLGGNSRDAEE
jgi:hypothetical protein